MGIEIPESLQWVAKYVVGAGDWPEGDETAMWRVEDAWVTLAAGLRDLGPDADHAIDQVLASIEGDTARAIADRWTELGHGQGAFDGLIQHIETLGDEIGAGATEIEYTKLVIIASLAVFAVTMAAALAVAATGVGAPAAGAQAAAAQVTTRIAISTAIKQLLQRVLSKAALQAAARGAVRGAWAAALDETAMDLGVKSVQVLTGSRDGITTEDLTEAGKNAVAAAATGAVTGGLEGLTSRNSPDGPEGNRNGPDPDNGDPDPPGRPGDQDPPGTNDRNPPEPGRQQDPPERGGEPNRPDQDGERNRADSENSPETPEGENPYVNAAWDGAAAAGTDIAETVTDDAVSAALDEDEEFSWDESLSPENLASSASAGVETGLGTLREGGSTAGGTDDGGPDRDSDPPNPRNDPPRSSESPPSPGSSESPPAGPPRQPGEGEPPTGVGHRNQPDPEGDPNTPGRSEGDPNASGGPGDPNASGGPAGENPFVGAARDAAAEAGTDIAATVTEDAVTAALDEEEEFSWEETLSGENLASAASAGVETGMGTLMEGGSEGNGTEPDPPNHRDDPPPSPDPAAHPPQQPPVSGAPPAAGPAAPEPAGNQQSPGPASPLPAPGPPGDAQPPPGREDPAAGNQSAPSAGSPPAGSPPGPPPSSLNITGAGETHPAATGAPSGPAAPEETPTSTAAAATATAAAPPVAPPAAPTPSPEAPRAGFGDPAVAAPGSAASANASRDRSRTGKTGPADQTNRPDGARGQDPLPPGGPAPSPTLANTPGFDYNLFDPAHHARVLADMSRPPIPLRPARTTPDENIWSADQHRPSESPSATPNRTEDPGPNQARADHPGPAPQRGRPGSSRPVDGPAGPTPQRVPAATPDPVLPRRPYWNEPRPTDPIWSSPHHDVTASGRDDPNRPGDSATTASRTDTAATNSPGTGSSGHTTATRNDSSPAFGGPDSPAPGTSAPARSLHSPGATPPTRSPGRPPLPAGGPFSASAQGRGPYATTPLQPEFRGEHVPGNRQWGHTFVKYLSVAERAPYRLFANAGLLYTCGQQPLDTRYTSTLWTPQGGRAIFVMDEYGQLYASAHHVSGEFHHSSLLAGGPVAAAGEIAAVQGRVQLISDHSTHYRPARQFTAQVVDSLARQGIAFDERAIEYHYPPDPNLR